MAIYSYIIFGFTSNKIHIIYNKLLDHVNFNIIIEYVYHETIDLIHTYIEKY